MTPASRSDVMKRTEWSRFTRTEHLCRYAVYLFTVAAVVWSARSIEIIPEFLADAPAQTADCEYIFIYSIYVICEHTFIYSVYAMYEYTFIYSTLSLLCQHTLSTQLYLCIM